MKFTPLPLEGAYLIETTPHHDERGYFARRFCKDEFKAHGLVTNFIQMSQAYNKEKGQVRGMHFQVAPHEETKVVMCIAGAVHDVILDLRPNSPTNGQHYSHTLSEENGAMLYVPKGFAHGYKTLKENTALFYMMDSPYVKEAARKISWEGYFG